MGHQEWWIQCRQSFSNNLVAGIKMKKREKEEEKEEEEEERKQWSPNHGFVGLSLGINPDGRERKEKEKELCLQCNRISYSHGQKAVTVCLLFKFSVCPLYTFNCNKVLKDKAEQRPVISLGL